MTLQIVSLFGVLHVCHYWEQNCSSLCCSSCLMYLISTSNGLDTNSTRQIYDRVGCKKFFKWSFTLFGGRGILIFTDIFIPCMSVLSHSVTMSSPSISPSPVPTGCPRNGVWPETALNTNASGSCFKGAVSGKNRWQLSWLPKSHTILPRSPMCHYVCILGNRYPSLFIRW